MKIPKFKLYNLKGELIKNTEWEYSEQKLLFKYLKPTDNVLQLGGNIGASCILVDKIIKKKNLNICVEPNPLILTTLKRNKSFNNSNFKILPFVLTKKKNLKLKYNKNNLQLNYWGARISNKGNVKIKSKNLNKINKINRINIIFADCEGCLENFLKNFIYILKNIRLVIYEKDQEDYCNYSDVEKILKKHKFIRIKKSYINYIWKNINY
jgi:FkbM family methyltransferase